jgi:hypothetical protein
MDRRMTTTGDNCQSPSSAGDEEGRSRIYYTRACFLKQAQVVSGH